MLTNLVFKLKAQAKIIPEITHLINNSTKKQKGIPFSFLLNCHYFFCLLLLWCHAHPLNFLARNSYLDDLSQLGIK